MMFALLKLVSMLLSVESAACLCKSWTAVANKSTQYISVTDYANNENCTITIEPFRHSYPTYLEISWLQFDVKGDMPNCDGDYVEVFTTETYSTKKPYYSIGKYCSNNLKTTSLFNMYSRVGYAKIQFISDGSTTGRGFKLSYKMRETITEYLGNFSSTQCSKNATSSKSGLIFSPGWPLGHGIYHQYTCNMVLEAGSDVSTRIVIMDINLPRDCPKESYFRVRGSDHDEKGTYDVTAKMCRDTIASLLTNYKYLNFDFSRKYSSFSMYKRGFVAGYILFDQFEDKKSKPSGSDLSCLIASVVAGVIAFILIIVIVIWLCKRSSSRSSVVGSRETGNVNVGMAAVH